MAVDTRPVHRAPNRTPRRPATLTEAAPRTLGLLDQLGFWGNLGVSLLGFTRRHRDPGAVRRAAAELRRPR